MDHRVVLAIASIGLTVVAGGVTFAAATAMQDNATMSAPEFPGAQIRTTKVPPTFELTNQDGEKVSLEALRGKVVLLTAVYATCHTACPTIITKAKAAVGRLSEAQRQDLAIVAITLDPEGDTQEKRASAAKAHSLAPPLFHYVNGDDPAVVLKLIDDLGWARAVAADTGVIGHSNLFLLVDRQGKIAYTVSADGNDDWLDRGLQDLLDE